MTFKRLIDIDGHIPGEEPRQLQRAATTNLPTNISLERLRKENEALSRMLKRNKQNTAGGYPSLREIQQAQRSAASVPIPPSPQPHKHANGSADSGAEIENARDNDVANVSGGSSLFDIQARIDRISKSIGDMNANRSDESGGEELAVTLRATPDTQSQLSQAQQVQQISEHEEDALIERLKSSIASIASLRTQVQKGSQDIDDARLKKERCFALMEVLDGKIKNLEEQITF